MPFLDDNSCFEELVQLLMHPMGEVFWHVTNALFHMIRKKTIALERVLSAFEGVTLCYWSKVLLLLGVQSFENSDLKVMDIMKYYNLMLCTLNDHLKENDEVELTIQGIQSLSVLPKVLPESFILI